MPPDPASPLRPRGGAAGGGLHADAPPPSLVDDGFPSPEAEEMLARSPGCLVQWGNALTLVALAAGLAVAHVVRYPDTVVAPAVVASARPAVRVSPPASGRVGRLLVAEKDAVEAGDALAVLDGPARPEDVRRLKGWLGDGAWSPSRLARGVPPPRALDLGPVGSPFARLHAALSAWSSYAAEPFYDLRDRARSSRVQTQRELRRVLEREVSLAAEELGIARTEAARTRALFERDVVSAADVNASERAVVAQERRLAQAEAALGRSGSEAAGLSESEAAARSDRAAVLRGLERDVAVAASAVSDAVAEWEHGHVVTAPAAGRVTFLRPIQAGDAVRAGEPFAAVVPDDGGAEVRLLLDPAAAARVEVGQPVRVAVSGYPPVRFGVLEGVIDDLGLVPIESGYTATVRLRGGLTTTYGEALRLRQELPAEGRVTIREASVLDRILERVLGAFD